MTCASSPSVADQWITGGALAISTLAAAKIITAAKTLVILANGAGPLKGLAVGLWVLTMLWLPVLVLAEAIRPRVSYDIRRWSTVFPVGMYAACSFAVGAASQTGAVTSFAQVWVWSPWRCGRSYPRPRCTAPGRSCAGRSRRTHAAATGLHPVDTAPGRPQ